MALRDRELWITFSDIPILAGACTLLYQLYHWVMTGKWLHLTVTTGLTYMHWAKPQTGHTVSQRLVDWLCNLPLCFGMMFVGVAMILGYYVIQQTWYKITRALRRTTSQPPSSAA
jgi:hypothetical protein